MVRPHLIPLVIAGPTGSGKSALAMRLARAHRGEIICADSRQFYAGMAIGTASPTYDEMKEIPHHGFGIIDPKEHKIDAGFFVNFARAKIQEIQARHNRPILVGGTGLYLRALYYGIHDVPASHEAIVAKLNQRCTEEGLPNLYQELMRIDPASAAHILPNDRYRIIRALEIFEQSGKRPSALRVSFHQNQAQVKAHWLYKKPPREELISRLKIRLMDMFKNGLLNEALALENRLPKGHWALSVMGFHEALMLAHGALTMDEAIEKAFIRHRQYAKRQYTWFNKEPFYRFVAP